MPYKHKEDQHAWYRANKTRIYAKTCKRRKAYQKWFLSLKSKLSCIRCSENHLRCLDFHHRSNADKVAAIADMISDTRPKAAVLAEIAKCDVLCANCHRKISHPLPCNDVEETLQ